MHSTLRVSANLWLLAAYVALLGVCLSFAGPIKMPVIAAFLIAGLLAGALQGVAINASPTEFRAAQTARAVRKVLISSFPGKASICLLWLGGLAALALVGSKTESQSVLYPLACYVAFCAAREVAALPALRRLKPT